MIAAGSGVVKANTYPREFWSLGEDNYRCYLTQWNFIPAFCLAQCRKATIKCALLLNHSHEVCAHFFCHSFPLFCVPPKVHHQTVTSLPTLALWASLDLISCFLFTSWSLIWTHQASPRKPFYFQCGKEHFAFSGMMNKYGTTTHFGLSMSPWMKPAEWPLIITVKEEEVAVDRIAMVT